MRRLPPHRLAAGLLVVLMALALPRSAGAQGTGGAPEAVEELFYRNAVDGTPLSAWLHLPAGRAPFPAVVALTLAAPGPLVERLTGMGWAVLVPERRGMGGAPELELAATFSDLAGDVSAAAARASEHPAVAPGPPGILGHGAETTVATLAALQGEAPAFLVLVSPRGVPGDAVFREQQLRSGRDRGLDASERAELERVVEGLSELARSPEHPDLKAYRVRSLLRGAGVRPRQSSSLPAELEGQVRFFASSWWHDWSTLEPDSLLAEVEAPILLLSGRDDDAVPFERHLPPLRSALERAPSPDATACVVEGRVEHAFPEEALDALQQWIGLRSGGEAGGATFRARPDGVRPAPCLEGPEAR